MDSSLKSETIEGYIDKNEWGSIFEITTNPDRYTQSEIGSDCINGVYEEQAPKLEDKKQDIIKTIDSSKIKQIGVKGEFIKKSQNNTMTLLLWLALQRPILIITKKMSWNEETSKSKTILKRLWFSWKTYLL